MNEEIDPIINNWYQHLDKGQEFRIINIEADNGLIEIQYFDGDLDELDLDTWYESSLSLIEEPENWSGPVDIENPDDYGTEVTDTSEEDWNAQTYELNDADSNDASFVDEGEEQEIMLIARDEGMDEVMLRS